MYSGIVRISIAAAIYIKANNFPAVVARLGAHDGLLHLPDHNPNIYTSVGLFHYCNKKILDVFQQSYINKTNIIYTMSKRLKTNTEEFLIKQLERTQRELDEARERKRILQVKVQRRKE